MLAKKGASYIERDGCPLNTAIGVIQGRWKPMIFRRLGGGALGFGELRRTMPGVTIKVLRQQLRELESEGLLVRSALRKPGQPVKYQITAHGETIGPLFESLWMWGTLHLSHLRNLANLASDTGAAK